MNPMNPMNPLQGSSAIYLPCSPFCLQNKYFNPRMYIPGFIGFIEGRFWAIFMNNLINIRVSDEPDELRCTTAINGFYLLRGFLAVFSRFFGGCR